LIADDSVTVLNMLKDVMEKANFKVETATNGQEAWDILERLNAAAKEKGKKLTDRVQVVISDIEMPAVDGFSLTKKIKSSPDFPNMPVILFSSLISERLRHKGESVGADDQISKPEVSELARRAKSLIQEMRS
jgi:two-component system chemotaxis response regulator CheV